MTTNAPTTLHCYCAYRACARIIMRRPGGAAPPAQAPGLAWWLCSYDFSFSFLTKFADQLLRDSREKVVQSSAVFLYMHAVSRSSCSFRLNSNRYLYPSYTPLCLSPFSPARMYLHPLWTGRCANGQCWLGALLSGAQNPAGRTE